MAFMPSGGSLLGKQLQRDVATSFLSRARYTSPIPPAPIAWRIS
jgi:hypothetical protein